MIYIALLRGVNVGGKNPLNMKRLKLSLESSGYAWVETYINSGNILFSDTEKTPSALEKEIEDILQMDFGLNIPVVVRSLEAIRALIKALPESWRNDQEMKCDVIFLWNTCSHEMIRQIVEPKPEIDTVLYLDGAILWAVERKLATKSGLARIVGTSVYRQVTIRNVNTLRNVYHIMCTMENKLKVEA